MIYLFYVIVAFAGIMSMIDGVRCFTESGRQKFIEKKRKITESYDKYNDVKFYTLGVFAIALSILFMYSSFVYFMGE